MRLILTFLLISNLNSCKTIPVSEEGLSTPHVVTECPKDGTCSIEVLKNKSLSIKSDEFGNLYPEINEDKFTVLKFEYIRNEIPDTVDSAYREIIYMQLDPESMETELQDKDLSKMNLLFGRLCFCKGQTGYYKVKVGDLSIKQTDKNIYQINLKFKSEEVPQVIHHITETIQL